MLERVRDKRMEQDEKWGTDDSPWATWMLILTEEVGELAEAVLESLPGDSLDLLDIQNEAIDVAAVAVAIAEQTQRKLPAGT